MVSSREILEHAGIKAMKTLTRWHQRGLIPPPEIKTHPNGRGKMAYWPDWVLDRCKRIRQLTDAGLGLDKIRETLGTDLGKQRARREREYSFTKASAEIDQQAARINLSDQVFAKLRPLLRACNSASLTEKIDKGLSYRRALGGILEIVEQGFNPVLIFDGSEATVVPDFLVAAILAKSATHGVPFLAVPVFSELRSALGALIDLPSEPVVAPITRVCKQDEDGVTEQEFRMVGLTDYEMVTGDREESSDE